MFTKSVAGSVFAPQTQAHSIIPANPLFILSTSDNHSFKKSNSLDLLLSS